MLTLQLPITMQTVQRRRHPRVDLDAPVHMVVMDGDRTISGVFRDLSAGGAALRTEEPVLAGETVRLMFAVGSGLFLQDLEAEIVRCTEGPDGRYLVALHFHCELEHEEALASWVNRQLAGG